MLKVKAVKSFSDSELGFVAIDSEITIDEGALDRVQTLVEVLDKDVAVEEPEVEEAEAEAEPEEKKEKKKSGKAKKENK